MRLILQLAHITDLHYAPDSIFAGKVRAGLGGLSLFTSLRQGLMGHDPSALRAFRKSLAKILKTREVADKTWLIVTGDLSTWGDQKSIRAMNHWAKKIATDLKVNCAAIYGNHDVWKEDLPKQTSQS